MFRKLKASPATQGASAAGSSASEKKEKKKNMKKKHIDGQKIWRVLGYATAAVFILVAVQQTTGAFSNISAASIIYNHELARMRAEEEKARQAVADELNVDINDDGTIISKDDTSDSNPIDLNSDEYYMDENGNIIHIDESGKATVYYICTTCSECGAVTCNGTVCAKCGCELYKYTVYQVQKGDTLSEVSGKVGASVDSIAHLNELDDVNLIYAGESLRIPK